MQCCQSVSMCCCTGSVSVGRGLPAWVVGNGLEQQRMWSNMSLDEFHTHVENEIHNGLVTESSLHTNRIVIIKQITTSKK